eukprot:TRINITY_DN278_c0_g1_i27.p2 TRINITY_DN278_c0_g1~~TRINITY_DN278_c0_g1_i27.p2  ORF type:complete len:134 (-),score=65.77 TRINITY_DN278_c0_g1_i27:48-407(-)
MLRSLVGSEMCIRDRYQRRVRGTHTTTHGTQRRRHCPPIQGRARIQGQVRHRPHVGDHQGPRVLPRGGRGAGGVEPTFFFFFFFKQKTAYEMLRSLVGSEMCIRDSTCLLYTSPSPRDS